MSQALPTKIDRSDLWVLSYLRLVVSKPLLHGSNKHRLHLLQTFNDLSKNQRKTFEPAESDHSQGTENKLVEVIFRIDVKHGVDSLGHHENGSRRLCALKREVNGVMDMPAANLDQDISYARVALCESCQQEEMFEDEICRDL